MQDKKPLIKKDVVIIGAGAAGLMCSIEAGKRNRSVLVLDHMGTIGKKIRFQGAGAAILRTYICGLTITCLQTPISANPRSHGLLPMILSLW